MYSISLQVLVQEYLDTIISSTWRIFKSDILIAAEKRKIYRKYWVFEKHVLSNAGESSIPFSLSVAQDCDDNEDKSCCTTTHHSGRNHLVNYEEFVMKNTLCYHICMMYIHHCSLDLLIKYNK